jgi:ATP-dependent exoDNAse (exonuclease V) beta subunit
MSRHDTFSTCRRRYFYSYYASALDPEIQRLKKLSALPLWAGNVVHEAIERFLRATTGMPDAAEQEAFIRATVHEGMLADWKDSEQGSLRFRLFEHEYGVTVDAEDKKIVVGIVMRSLRNFFRSATLQEALRVGRERWLTLEDLVSFDVEGVSVLLRMDLAFRDESGRVVIVDWKTGRGEGRFSELQVAGYALYAAHSGWVKSAEEIQTELAYLAIPRFVRRPVNSQTLERSRAFIKKSSSTMKSLLIDPLLNEARLEDFPMVERPRVCRRCNFKKLCFPREEARAELATTPSIARAD